MAGRLPLIAALLLALLIACKRSDNASGIQAERRPDPYADGKRLSAAGAGFAARWQRVGNLPDCAPLLGVTEAPLCKEARTALSTMQQEVGKEASADVIIRQAANTALAAERATAELRREGLDKFVTEQKTDAKSSAAAGSPSATTDKSPPTEKRTPKPKGTASAAPFGGATDEHVTREHDNPHLDAIQAYSSVATLGLRQLAVYLENGPIATRRKAAAELERLHGEEPRWSRLRALAREATLIEPDPDLKKRLNEIGDPAPKK